MVASPPAAAPPNQLAVISTPSLPPATPQQQLTLPMQTRPHGYHVEVDVVTEVDANVDLGDDGAPPPPPPPDESDGGADDVSNGPGATDQVDEDDDSVVFVKVVARAPERPKPVRRARATADFRWSPEKEAQRPQRLSKRRPRSPTTPSRRKRRSAPQNDTPGPSPPPDAVAT